ncbi:TPA: ABC-F family ATP-binding cassette domain-containing protein [Staphylococcus delphini]|nr:ABC-F family ATP-binding cassette domain-containing protein [Staphylococcus delphini]HEC2195512.1 ABC-F family ATP-binding cassette domain-containing protein [Staphylococcus delphini]
MMGHIRIKNLSFKYTDAIFTDLNLNIDDSWKLGLIGRNGRGKTTFLKLLLNQLEYEGQIDASVTFKYFPVYPERQQYVTVEEMLLERNPTIEPWRIYKEFSLIGLDTALLYRDFDTLSGGEQVRVLLVELFLEDYSFALIDAPTNHLDIEGRQVVQRYLDKKKGYILVSHDRQFLDHTVEYILSINKNNIELIKGNLKTWETEKAHADQLTQEKNETLKKEIKRLDQVSKSLKSWGASRENSSKDSFDKARAAKLMKRSKTVVKRNERKIEEKQALIDNVEKVETIQLDVDIVKKRVLSLRNFSILMDGKPLFKPITVTLLPSEILFIIGENGVGKSTLFNFIQHPEQYDIVGEYDIHLPEKTSVVDQKYVYQDDYNQCFQTLPQPQKEKFLHFLYQLGVDKKKFTARQTEGWSDGEKKKVLIAYSLIQQNSLLMWDEVTNYLDFYVVDQLIDMLANARPTMIAIDHNAHFVKTLDSKTIQLVRDEGIEI